MPKTKRTKTGYTTDADALVALHEQTQHPFLTHLLRHRDVTRLKTTVEGLLKSVSDDGRIHTTYQQTVAATGRLSSTEPNLQNIPIRTDEGRLIRRAFIPGPDADVLLTADYSQIEMRIMATLSEDDGLIEAFRSGEDLHTFVAMRAFGLPASEVTPEMRRRIKAMSYGLAYGLSAFGLSGQLKISVDEAREQMEAYFARFGGVRDYLRRTVDQARKDGYTETVFGRRRYVPDLTSDNRQKREMAERIALNAPIQGSAADIIKVAMLGVQRRIEREGLRSQDAAAGARRARLPGGRRASRTAMTALLHEEMAGRVPAGRAARGVRRRREGLGRRGALRPQPGGRIRHRPAAGRGRVPGGGSTPADHAGRRSVRYAPCSRYAATPGGHGRRGRHASALHPARRLPVWTSKPPRTTTRSPRCRRRRSGCISVLGFVLAVVFVIAYVQIVRRAGYSGWWILIMLVPIAEHRDAVDLRLQGMADPARAARAAGLGEPDPARPGTGRVSAGPVVRRLRLGRRRHRRAAPPAATARPTSRPDDGPARPTSRRAAAEPGPPEHGPSQRPRSRPVAGG